MKMVKRRGFVSEKQRRAFFVTGNFVRAPRTPEQSNNIIAFSYKDGRSLEKFINLKEVFKRFP